MNLNEQIKALKGAIKSAEYHGLNSSNCEKLLIELLKRKARL